MRAQPAPTPVRLRGLGALLCTALASPACGGKSDGEATTDTSDAGGDGGASDGATDGGDGGADGGGGPPCPPEVPEDYQYLWDCQLASCPGGPLLYLYGTGSSTGEPPASTLSVTEQWFVFSPDYDNGFCTDTFAVEGAWSTVDPASFRCSECEETWQVQWTLTTGNACALSWGMLFFGEDGADETDGPFEGYLMLDTHGALSGRTDNALVVGAPVLGRSAYTNPDWGLAAVVPTTSYDGPPEDYVWTNRNGICANGGRLVAGPAGEWIPSQDLLNEIAERRAEAHGLTPLR
jgi:hypothetical protein